MSGCPDMVAEAQGASPGKRGNPFSHRHRCLHHSDTRHEARFEGVGGEWEICLQRAFEVLVPFREWHPGLHTRCWTARERP